MRTSWLNDCFYSCYFLKDHKCKPFWNSCHWVSLHHIVLNRSKLLKVVVNILFSCATYSSNKYFPCFNILWWILLSCRTIWLRLRCSTVVWHLFFSCERKLSGSTHLTIWVSISLSLSVGICISITLLSITLLVRTLLISLVLLSILCCSVLLLLCLLPIILTLSVWTSTSLTLISMLTVCSRAL